MTPPLPARDHGGRLDEARRLYGGNRDQWVDLSTGINPEPYPVPQISRDAWSRLPDAAATGAVEAAARQFWNVPVDAAVLAAPGASLLIAQMPRLRRGETVRIVQPTYNEHAAAFRAAGWRTTLAGPAEACVLVHPNNPDGRFFDENDICDGLTIIDESFCDVTPGASLIGHATRPNVVVLKSFGKFWGLAGLRLGFAVSHPETIATLADMLGPWLVSGPALEIGTAALSDPHWAEDTRRRLRQDRQRLDQAMVQAGARVAGGTDLFGLYRVSDAADWHDRLARAHIWTRIFPYAHDLLRLGLPPANAWNRVEAAL